MTKTVLTNPDAPRRSAKRIVDRAPFKTGLPAAVKQPVVDMLANYLAAQQDCQSPAKNPEETWHENAKQARRRGQPCSTFRLRTHVADQIETGLNYLVRAARHTGSMGGAPNASEDVRYAAGKLLKSVEDRRITWPEVEHKGRRLGGLIQKSGRNRVAATPVRKPLSLDVPTGQRWREVVTPKELVSIGRANGLCVHLPHYRQWLKTKVRRFFQLECAFTSAFIGLLSLRTSGRFVEEVRAAANARLGIEHRDAVLLLLEHLRANMGDSADMLALGLTDVGPPVDLNRPERRIQTIDVWTLIADAEDDADEDFADCAPPTAMLIRCGDDFGLVRESAVGRFSVEMGTHSELDGHDLLGRLLKG